MHPDIVGIYFPFDEYSKETIELQEMMGNKQYKIYSFELKKTLNFSNLREYYFQAVSNSSWANEGYLVTLDMDEDESFLLELKRLNNAFGIGVIKLNAENISQSEVVFASKENAKLDWETIDRLAENPDFKQFIEEIRLDANDKQIRTQYDEVDTDDEKAAEYARSKNII